MTVAGGAWVGVLVLLAASAHAHLVYGTPTLLRLVAESDVVARARVLDAEDVLVLEGSGLRRPLVRVRVTEVLKGGATEEDAEASAEGDAGHVRAGRVLRFAQHGHGVAPFETGDDALLFLRRIERSRELDHLAGAGDLRFVSVQEHDAHYVLEGEAGLARLAAARAYAGLSSLPRPEDRRAALRRITLSLLGSEEPRLARSALRDWVMAGDAPLLHEEDASALDALVADPTRDIGVRLGVLAELDRRGWVEGPPRWTALLEATRGADRLAVVRAAGAHPSPPVTEALVALLGDDDAVLAAAAAIALGAPGNDAAVAPLVGAAGDPRPRLRGAALRGLGNVGTPAARDALAGLAASHEDPDTRRRAAAELRVLEGTGPGGGQAP